MTTFSQLVDDMVSELVRPDLRDAMATYVNQSVREIHIKPNVSSAILFDANRFEDQLTVNTNDGYLFTLPSPTHFMDVEAMYARSRGIYVRKRSPRVVRNPSTEVYNDIYWYRSGAYLSISGLGINDIIDLSWFEYPRSLKYQPLTGISPRVVTYDIELDTYKLIIGGGVPSDAQMLVATHWMLQRHSEVIKQGVRAKIWARVGDGDRARMAFSSFEQGRQGIWMSEPSSGEQNDQ